MGLQLWKIWTLRWKVLGKWLKRISKFQPESLNAQNYYVKGNKQWLQDSSEINGDIRTICETRRHFSKKKGRTSERQN
jgi:hypothetical protein